MKFPSTVADVMNEIISIDGESLVVDAAKIIVTEEGNPVGIITESDMLARVIVAYHDPKKILVKKVMTSPLVSIEKDSTILDAMRFLRDQDIHIVLVKDDGKLTGIVSEGDLIRAVTLSSLSQFSSILRRT